MTLDNENFEEKPEALEEVPKYEELVTEESEREVGDDEYSAPRTATEEEEGAPQRSDLKEAMVRLLPRYPTKRLNDVLQPAMVSRIFPDNYIDKHFLLSSALIEECEPEKDVDVVGIISLVQDALSIGYEGRCRIDILEIAGVAHEEEMEKLSKELGL